MKRRKIGVLLGTFIGIAIISGAITSAVLFYHHKKNQDMQEKMASQSVEEEKEEKASIKEIIQKSDEMYLESYLGSTHLVEIDQEDKEEILNEIKKLDVKLLVHSKEGMEDLEEYDEFLYGIHIKNKNMKIKTNEKYIIVEDTKGDTKFFEGDSTHLQSLNDKLKNIYMNKYNDNKWIKQAKEIMIEAKDENQKWILRENDKKKLLELIELMAPVEKKEIIGICSEYPDYVIEITAEEKKYKIHMLNKEILNLDTSDNYVYYRYNSKLWDFITKKYPVKFANTDPCKELLKASKIIVDDASDEFDFEDTTFYPLEMARWIIKAPKEEVDELPMYEPISYEIKFQGKNKMMEVKIYEDYIVYEGKIYRSEKIGETIRSALNV
ncbi:hypothetical protein [Inediibacterium massiliense]|uniref:hypothetical protein n=1 Tax=Inediibacterium massiliense TaxID=1658111 RepID=UPI0006B3FEC7|nr:hypothetical protein [Inediibacterium massiliense]